MSLIDEAFITMNKKINDFLEKISKHKKKTKKINDLSDILIKEVANLYQLLYDLS